MGRRRRALHSCLTHPQCVRTKKQSVMAIVANFRSMLSKQREFECFTSSYEPNIILGTETWLPRGIDDPELILCENYKIFRKDRSAGRGGGVLIAAKNNLLCTLGDCIFDLEILWIGIEIDFLQVLIVVCYRPPSCCPPVFNQNVF